MVLGLGLDNLAIGKLWGLIQDYDVSFDTDIKLPLWGFDELDLDKLTFCELNSMLSTTGFKEIITEQVFLMAIAVIHNDVTQTYEDYEAMEALAINQAYHQRVGLLLKGDIDTLLEIASECE
jgi:hypothetical protein